MTQPEDKPGDAAPILNAFPVRVDDGFEVQEHHGSHNVTLARCYDHATAARIIAALRVAIPECGTLAMLIKLAEEEWDEQPSGDAILVGKHAVIDFLHMDEVRQALGVQSANAPECGRRYGETDAQDQQARFLNAEFGATPRTDAAPHGWNHLESAFSYVHEDFARQLERELAEMQMWRNEWKARAEAVSASGNTPDAGAYRWINKAVELLRAAGNNGQGLGSEWFQRTDELLSGVPIPQTDLGFDSPADRAAQSTPGASEADHLRMQIGYIATELMVRGDPRSLTEIVETAAKATAPASATRTIFELPDDEAKAALDKNLSASTTVHPK